ncbi:hypothetical protein LTR28_004857 [Elasticomyces elasticus]|nr:hypothetical protein LTR28_004857 [Elasticomyces elasticus]
MSFNGTAKAYKDRCSDFLLTLCNDRDIEGASKYLAPDCVLIHDSFPPVTSAEAFVQNWKVNLDNMPRYHKDIKATVAELEGEKGATVWCYSVISGCGPDGTEIRDSIGQHKEYRDFGAEGTMLVRWPIA